MEPELIATLVQTGLSLYRVYCKECKEHIEVKGKVSENKFETTCPDCGHHIHAKIK